MIEIKLDELLSKRGWSYYRLAKDSSVSYPTISRWRRQRVRDINVAVLSKICETLRCTPGDILMLTPARQPRLKASYHPFTRIAVTVRDWRKAFNLEFYEVVKRSGVSPSVLWRWENESLTEISLPVLEKFCETLQCTPGDLVVLANGEETRERIASIR